jgi:pilus assembly protein CpaF
MTAALLDRVRARLIEQRVDASPAQVAAALRAEGMVLGDEAVLDLVRDLRHRLVGAGPLEPILADPEVTDVLVTGPLDVWVDRGGGLERVDVRFVDEADVRRLAQRLAAGAGRRLDEAVPYVDARLPDGTRVHAVIPPIAVDGTALSLRVPRRRAFTVADLVAAGSVDEAGADWLADLVRARLAVLISGGTGSGKTTILAALLGLVPAHERIVIVEDAVELSPDHPHVVRLQSRLPNIEGAGAVTLRDLVRQSLRMRPDRLVVGEVRGAEVVDLLAALNTGHEGGWATVHANAAADVPARLEALGLLAGIDAQALHALAAAALDAVVHLSRERDGRRVVASIHVVDRAGGSLRTIPALRRHGDRLVAEEGRDLLARRVGR